MSTNLEDIAKMIENGEIEKVSKDDTFKFGCKACGQCCRNRNDIMVSPYDIFKIAKYLGMTTEAFCQKHTLFHMGPHSGWPIITIKFKEKSENDTVCTFLKHKEGKFLCEIHEAKPYICIAYPLGRMVKWNKGEEVANEIDYILQDVVCNADKKTEQKVSDWLRPEREESDKFFLEQNLLMAKVNEIIDLHKLNENKKLETTTKNLILLPLVQSLYFEYDMERPFMEQYAKRQEQICKVLKEIVDICKKGNIKLY